MSKTTVVINKHTIELSNLDKVLFPGDGIVKAELIEYYLKVAPTLLRHIKGRPLSLVRYPDGITGETFYQKNRPGWAPDWVARVALGDIEYIVANEEATLAWLANLACLELHQYHWRDSDVDRPDYAVYDLDPPEGGPFERVVETALALRPHLESLGYHALLKTSGGKGLHVVTPLEPKHTTAEVFEAALDAARPFVEAHAALTTLHLKKEARKGRILVDVYRNRTSQSIVGAYSVRGRPRAPVSMPLEWADLENLTDPAAWNLHTAPERLTRTGDPWEAFGAHAMTLHTARPRPQPKPTARETPAALREYERKRSFAKTPEPPPALVKGEGNAFVVHRHHASRLHYDLRLERDGVLRSWAVPKGLPPRPGVKRLAVATEDHPFEYLRFEGTIPKGEYGAGNMWIFALGKYQITKEKRDGFYFRLHSPEINAEYRMIHTKEKDWLLERVDAVQIDWLREPVDPMLAHSRDEPPDSKNFLYEVKWDGIRALIALDEGQITIRSRSRRDVTRMFPELASAAEAFRATSALFDGEIVCLDGAGKPVFEHSVWRLHHEGERAVERARAAHPAVCYLFDCLYLDGRPICNEPIERRRAWLADAVRHGSEFRVSEALDDGRALYRAAADAGLEGIMAKERGSRYLPGKRSASWIKVKTRNTMECVILGYTRGKGDRAPAFGALHLGRYEQDRLSYLGKVGTGFDDALLKSVFRALREVPEGPRPVDTKPLDDAATVWLHPQLACEVQYASLTTESTLRAAVFVRLRPDLAAEDCRADSC